MVDIQELIYLIQKRPGISVGSNRVDYLFHYLTGRLEGSKGEKEALFCSTFAQYLHNQLEQDIAKKGSIQFSFYWYKMIYSITDDEDKAWELFFKIAHKYFAQIEE